MRSGCSCCVVDDFKQCTVCVVAPDAVVALGGEINSAIVPRNTFAAVEFMGSQQLVTRWSNDCERIRHIKPCDLHDSCGVNNLRNLQLALAQIRQRIRWNKTVQA